MTNLRGRIFTRFALVAAFIYATVAWLIFREAVEKSEPTEFSRWFKLCAFLILPALFTISWWLLRKSLNPLSDLASRVERFNAQTLGQRLPRTHNGDEVDRMAGTFNNMAARLEQSFQQIREFTLHGSHELKTPLTVIRAQLETTLARPDSLTPELHASLENLLDEVARLTKIVDGLSLLTKADAGMVTLDRNPVRLDELVREAVEDAEVLAQPGGINVQLTRCDKATINGDRHRLRQVLLNLADNAIKYNQPGGSVEFSLQRDGDFAELLVTNTGKGIPAELLDHVFDRFTRGNDALSKSLEGSGLGLTIAKWIIDSHNGLIRIASEIGKTTSIAVRLPIADSNDQPG